MSTGKKVSAKLEEDKEELVDIEEPIEPPEAPKKNIEQIPKPAKPSEAEELKIEKDIMVTQEQSLQNLRSQNEVNEEKLKNTKL